MPGLMTGLETARRALVAHQLRLGVLSHNIANAATRGYSRQEALLEPTPALGRPVNALGTGVTVAAIRRHRDPFFDARARTEQGLLGRYEAARTVLAQADAALAEPGDAGIGARLADFWSSWHELANRPRDASARAAVQGAGRALAGAFRAADARLRETARGLEDGIESSVAEVNRLAADVAALNASIAAAEASGGEASDLRDRRDLLVEELAGLAGATAVAEESGAVSVRVGGRFLVDGERALALAVEAAVPGDRTGGARPVWADGRALEGLGGRLGGLLEAGGALRALEGDLDRLAAAVITGVNRIHDDGTGALYFFRGGGAGDIGLAPAVEADAGAIRAGSGASGDNAIALALAGLESSALDGLAGESAGSYLAALVGRTGERAREAIDLAEAQALVLEQVESQRQAVSGVTLDEEAADLLAAQRAFQAAAQVVDTLDSLLETVILDMAR